MANEFDINKATDILKSRPQPSPAFDSNQYYIEGVDEALERRLDARRRQLTSIMDFASNYVPDVAAENQRTSATTGLSMDAVEDNPQEASRLARLKMINFNSILTQSPILAAQLSDPEFAKIAQDDLENLRYAEKLASGKGYQVSAEDFNLHADAESMMGNNIFSGAMASGGIGLGVSALGMGRAVSDLALSHVMDDEEGIVILQPENNPLAKGFSQAASRLEQYQKLWRPKTDNAVTSGLVSGIESAVQNIPFMLGGLVTGLPKLALGGMTSAVFGQEYQKAREKGLAPEKAFGYAGVQSTIEYVTEMVPMGKFFEALKTGGFLKGIVAQMPSEILGEQLATILQDAMETATLEPEKTWGQYLQERPDAAVETAVATLIGMVSQTAVGTLVQANMDTAMGIVRSPESIGQEDKRNFLQRMGDIAKSSKVLARNRERFESFIQDAAEDAGAPIQEVYINANTLYQSGVLDQVAELSPSVAEQMETALQTGGDIRIPIGEYTANIAGSEIGDALIPHIKTIDETGEIGRSIAEYEADEVGPLREAFEQAAQAQEDENSFRQSQEAVQQQILADLNTVGRYRTEVNENAATLISHYYSTRAAMLGKTPEQLYSENRLRFVGNKTQAQIEQEAFDQEGFVLEDHQNKIAFEVAPDPNNVELTARWNAIPSDKKLDISIRVADVIVPKVLENMGTTGEYSLQIGGYLGQTNPSLVLNIRDSEKALDTSKLLGYVLSQDSMMVVSDSPSEGLEKTGAVAIHFPESFGIAELTELYDRLWELEKNGEKLVIGYSASSGEMVILNNPEYSGVDTDELASIIDNHLGGEFEIATREYYAAFPEREEYGYDNSEVEGTQSRSSSGESGQKRWSHNHLRREASNLVQQLLDESGANSYYQSGRTVGVPDSGGRALRTGPVGDTVSGLPLSGRHSGTITSGPLRESDLGEIRLEYGTPIEGSSSVVGVHYSPSEKKTLSGYYYGTGLKGAEAKRLPNSKDGRISKRIYFYVDTGNGINPEVGVGSDVHAVRLNNVYDTSEDKLGIVANAPRTSDRANLVESAIIDAGFDGMYVPRAQGNQGVVVLLGYHNNVPVEYKGRHSSKGVVQSAPQKKTVNDLKEGYLFPSGGEGDYFTWAKNKEEIQKLAPSARVEWGRLFFEEKDMETLKRWFPKLSTSREVYQGDAFPRGSFNPDSLVISFLEGHDFSTIVHEGAHAFFEMDIGFVSELLTTKNYEELTEGERQLVDDVSELFKWHGIEGDITSQLNAWMEMDFEERRKHHEKTAESFEHYVMTGSAPSLELLDVFTNFKNWMLDVYRSIKNFLLRNPDAGDLNSGVREIFDRMLATREQIDQAHRFRHMVPLFKSAEEAAGYIDSYERYQEQNAVAIAESEAELQARSLRVQSMTTNAHGREMKKLRREAEATLKEIRTEVEAEVRSRPVYNAISYLTGKENTTGENGKISIDALVEMYAGENDRYALLDWKPLSSKRMTAKEGGLHPDILAERLGYESGDQMVREILNAPPIKEVVDAETDVRMLEEHGDLLDENAIRQAADEAVHNTARLRFVLAESNALNKALGNKQTAMKAARAVAVEVVNGLRIRDIRPSQYANAETRAARSAEKAMRAGDLRLAAFEKNNQMINTCLTREAQKTKAEIEKGVKYLRKFDKHIPAIDTDFQNQIHALLEDYDLRTLSLKEIDRRQSLKAFLEAREKEGLVPEIPEQFLEDARRTSYRNMTVGEFKGLLATIQQLEHLGREENRIRFMNEQHEREAVIQELLQGIEENAKGDGAENRTAYNTKSRLKQLMKGAIAAHLKVPTIARVLDGGKDAGPVWNFLVRTANEVIDRETSMTIDATEKLAEITKPLIKMKMGGKGTWFESIGMSLNRESVIAIALNMGNEGNLQRLLDGERWTLNQVLPVVQTLTAQEWQAVQDIWDFLETFRPAISEKQIRLYGKDLDYVEPRPLTVQTSDGQTLHLKGGYYPIVYDPRASMKSANKSAEQEAKDMLRQTYTSATTRDSFRKARVSEVNDRPLLYNMSGLWNGVQDVIHDLCVHEWLIAVNKIMRSNRLQTAIADNYGIEYVQQIRNWIGDIAAGNRATAKDRAFSMSWLRQGISASGLGFNIMSALQQPFGLTQSVVRIGARYVGSGMGRFFSDNKALIEEINGKSEFMRTRARTNNRELNELRNQMSTYGRYKDTVGKYTYFLMVNCQLVVDRITWAGAYEKALAEGHEDDVAVRLADQAVIDAQGSGMPKDLSAIERSPYAKLFTVFYGFMNTLFNMTYAQTMTENSKAKLAVDYLMLYALPCSLIYAMKLALTPGDDPEKWDMGKIGRGLLAENISYLMGTMVVVRELAQVGRMVTGTGAMSYKGPAGLRLIDDVGNLVTQTSQLEFDDAFRKALVNFIGDMTGLPAAQANRTITGLQAVAEGQTDGVYETVAAPVFGFAKRK